MCIRDSYYSSQSLYPTSRNGGFDKMMAAGTGNGGFQHHGGAYGDPGSPLGGYSSGGGGGLQYRSGGTLHNGLRGPHHDAALTHRPPSVASVSPTTAPAAALTDEKSPSALSPPLSSSSPGSSSPPAETERGGAATDTGDSGADEMAVASQQKSQQQMQSPTEPLIYPWMRRVHSGHGGKTTHAQTGCENLKQ